MRFCGRLFAGQTRNGFAKIAAGKELHQRDHVAALLAPSAVENSFSDIDGKSVGASASWTGANALNMSFCF